MRIFVTGGMGSGKSTLISYLESKGAAIVFADEVGHDNLLKLECRRALAKAFGNDILDDEGFVDRGALAAKAFANPQATARLDVITQPLLYDECLARVRALEKEYKVVVLEMAILDGRDDFYKNADIVVCVTADADLRVKRLMAHRGVSREDACNRIARQVPERQRIEISDVVLTNNGTLEDFLRQIDNWWEGLNVAS